eukprot:Platyproteum_vivax@DN2446_c0_g1_i1.p1
MHLHQTQPVSIPVHAQALSFTQPHQAVYAVPFSPIPSVVNPQSIPVPPVRIGAPPNPMGHYQAASVPAPQIAAMTNSNLSSRRGGASDGRLMDSPRVNIPNEPKPPTLKMPREPKGKSDTWDKIQQGLGIGKGKDTAKTSEEMKDYITELKKKIEEQHQLAVDMHQTLCMVIRQARSLDADLTLERNNREQEVTVFNAQLQQTRAYCNELVRPERMQEAQKYSQMLEQEIARLRATAAASTMAIPGLTPSSGVPAGASQVPSMSSMSAVVTENDRGSKAAASSLVPQPKPADAQDYLPVYLTPSTQNGLPTGPNESGDLVDRTSIDTHMTLARTAAPTTPSLR